MNYLEEQTDGEAMVNSIQNEKKTRKIDPLARSFLIQGLPNDIYSLIDSNKTAKDLWDALERQMRGSEYVINDLKKCGYKKDNCELNYKFLNNLQPEWKQYGTLMRQTKNLMDINIDALYNILKQNQGDVNDALGYKKKVVMVTSDPLALVAEKTKVSKSSSSANKKPEYVKSVEKKEDKKVDEKKRDMSKVKCYNSKKDSDKQVLLAEDQAWMESSSDSDQEINANMVFMAQIEKVLSDSDESSSSAEETIAEVAYYTSESESESEYETLEYYDNSTNYGLFVNNNNDQEFFHDAIESASENLIENHIDSQKDYDKYEVDHNDSEEKEHLIDMLIQKFNHKIAKCQKRIEKVNQQTKDLENQNKDLQDKYDVLINQVNTFEELNNEFNIQMKVLNEKNVDLLAQMEVLQDQLKFKHVVIDTHTECQAQYAKLEEERYEYMIRYSALCDNDKQHRKKIDEQEILFNKMSRQLVEMNNNVLRLQEIILEKETKISELERCVSNKDVKIEKCLEILNECKNKLHKIGKTNQTIHMIMYSKDTLYNGRNGIGFENPSYFEKAKDLRHSLYDEKVIDEVVSLLEKEKANLEIIESLKSKGFESSENAISETENQSENDCHVVEKECDNVENPKVIAPGMFKLSVSQSVSPISITKTSCASNCVESKLKRKRRKRKSSKQNDKQVNNDVLHANRDFVHFSDLDTFSSVRRPKSNGVIWKKKWSSNTYNVDLSSVSHLKLNKDVNRYSRKGLLSCNNSHFGETSSAYVCNDAMNVSCNSRLCDLFDENNLFIFDDESVRISPDSKMPFKKKPHDSMNVRSKRCSKNMTGNRALLTNFVEKFLGKVRFGKNDFAVIVGYGDVVIGSMTIKKVYYVEGLGHNLFSVGKFCVKGLEVAFRKSTCFVRNEDGVDLLPSDHSSNLYTIALNEVASNSSTCLLAKASSLQSWLWQQRLSHLNFATINNLMKNNLVQDGIFNRILKEEVYVGQPPGFVSKQYPDHVYALDKALYGLKQAPRAWIFRYLKGTINLGLLYPKDSSFDLTTYSDADHTRSHLDRKSTSGIVQSLGDKLVCWSSKKHNCVSVSTAKSEYVVVSGCCAQVLWMRTQLTDYGFFYDKVPIYCDLKSAIAISCNPVQHTQTKHIDVRTGIDLPQSLPPHLEKLGLGDGV
nr:uncharacterized mitochondrial protein AtMg00810-like [Tanacetum cinerariifolium]